VERGADPAKLRREARGIRTFKEVATEFMLLHVAAKRSPARPTNMTAFLRSTYCHLSVLAVSLI
jgi:hypothetical protein